MLKEASYFLPHVSILGVAGLGSDKIPTRYSPCSAIHGYPFICLFWGNQQKHFQLRVFRSAPGCSFTGWRGVMALSFLPFHLT